MTNPKTVLTLGQSGQAYSAHYDDQVALWAAGKYKTVTMAPSEFRKSGKQLTLMPEKSE
jgi:acyl-homoserine lactone acylase PvdQ